MIQSDESLSASLEDYLEAIFHVEAHKHAARAKDIAERLQVSSASVTGALRLLTEKALINYAPYDIITLTVKGRAVAQEIVNRHDMLREFFVKILAIDAAEAEVAACRMEHGVSSVILERMTRLLEFWETCPRGGHKWNETVGAFCAQGASRAGCEQCLSQCLQELQK